MTSYTVAVHQGKSITVLPWEHYKQSDTKSSVITDLAKVSSCQLSLEIKNIDPTMTVRYYVNGQKVFSKYFDFGGDQSEKIIDIRDKIVEGKNEFKAEVEVPLVHFIPRSATFFSHYTIEYTGDYVPPKPPEPPEEPFDILQMIPNIIILIIVLALIFMFYRYMPPPKKRK